jgi:N utilization substance protein A
MALLQAVEQLGRDKGIAVDSLIGALEDAITAASRRRLEREGGGEEGLLARLDRESGRIRVHARKRVVAEAADPRTEIGLAEARAIDPEAALDGFVDVPRTTVGLGRAEAQAARQVLLTKVREAERERIFEQQRARVGELVTGIVQQVERGDVHLDVGRATALLPRRFQSRGDAFAAGDRVRAVVVEVNRNLKGPQILVSRVDAALLLRLLEFEVPEVQDGTVRLKAVAREAGERSKVAVSSGRPEVDAVGACVGVKGARIQAIIRELGGEKVDVVAWQDEPSALAASVLGPARVVRVGAAPDDPALFQARVDAEQLSLAIGKRGQNVRLASRLLGRRIEIQGPEEPPAAAGAADAASAGVAAELLAAQLEQASPGSGLQPRKG